MDTIELLAKFGNPEMIESLTLAQRMMAGLITTILGMGITFLSLIILQFVIALMARFTAEPKKKVSVIQQQETTTEQEDAKEDVTNDEEVVAAVTVAIAMQLKTSVSNIIIRNIEKVEETSTAWRKAGIAEQMNNSM